MTTAEKNFDITALMSPYLDVHMISPLLDYLREVMCLSVFMILMDNVLISRFSTCLSSI